MTAWSWSGLTVCAILLLTGVEWYVVMWLTFDTLVVGVVEGLAALLLVVVCNAVALRFVWPDAEGDGRGGRA